MMDLWIIQNLSPLFYRVMELSIAAVCIGLGVLLLRKVADKRISPIWKNALWLLVLVALVVPYRPSSNVAVIPTTQVNFRQQENILHTEITQEKTESLDNYQVPVELTTQRETLHIKSLIFQVAIPGIWLFGMVVMMGILLVTRQKMFRGMKTTGNHPLLVDCKRQLGITHTVEIVEQSYLKTPALYSLFHPKILLPDYVAEMSEDSQRYILLHELSHLKHWDLWKNTLLLALQVVYWFNPLVWLLFRFIRQDMELLNDQRVLKILEKSEETPYAMSLIQVLGHSKKLPLAPQMLCMVDNKGNTKRRIQMIQLGEVFKKHKIIIAVGCLAVIGVLSALFLTSQASPLHWAHTLDKDDVEKVELYLAEKGQGRATFLLDENQRATLCIMLNNFNGEECEDTEMGMRTTAQYTVYLSDGTVEDVSFCLTEEDTCFFRFGEHNYWGDQYQMNDWLGLSNSIFYDQAPPSSNESKLLMDLANNPNVTIVDYVPMDDMAYGYCGIVCYTTLGDDGVTFAYLPEGYPKHITDPSVTVLPDSKLSYLGDGACEIVLTQKETERPILYTLKNLPGEDETFQMASSQCYLQLTAPKFHQDDSIGIGAFLDYADETKVIFHGYFGLFVYDKLQEKITVAVDLEQAVGTNSIQGDDPAFVSVDGKGETMMLWRNSMVEEDVLQSYYIDTTTGSFEKRACEPFQISSPSTTDYPFQGGTLGTLAYEENGQVYHLFSGYAGMDISDPWGITLTATDVTPTGMNLVCTQSGGGEYYTGEDYAIERLENGTWTALTTSDTYWYDIAWNIPPDGTTTWELVWRYLYGDLPAGTYRLSKEIYSGQDATNAATYHVQFEVPDERVHPIYDSQLANAPET